MKLKYLIGFLALFFCIAMAAGPAFSQKKNTCPAGFPVDCGNTRCCPSNTWCLPEGGCAPNGWSSCGRGKICPPGKSVACPRLAKCYASPADAQRAGCSIAEQVVCGRPVR